MDKIFTILFFAFSFGLSVFGNSRPKEQNVLYGVDNVQLPNDSLVLMNSLLVDYQVDYDIALATKNPNDIVSSLHKIGLVYLKLNQFDLAANYGWRLLNVSQKYEIHEFELYAYAMLYRVYKDSGNQKQSKDIYKDYQTKLANIGEVVANKRFAIPSNVSNTEVVLIAKQEKQEVSDTEESVNLSKLKREAKIFDMPYWIFIGVVGVIGFLFVLRFFRPSPKPLIKVIDVPAVAAVDIEHTVVKNEFKKAEPKKSEPKESPVRIAVGVESTPVSPFVVNQPLAQKTEEVVAQNSHFTNLVNKVSDMFSSKGVQFDLTVLGEFKHFSENSFSGFLFIFEAILQQVSTHNSEKLTIQWVEVPKGMVLNVQFQEDTLIWNRNSFEDWGKEIFDRYQIIVNLLPGSNNQSTLVFKKYY